MKGNMLSFLHNAGGKWWVCLLADGWTLTHPLCSAALGSLLLLTLIMSKEKSRKNMAIPKQTRYTAL